MEHSRLRRNDDAGASEHHMIDDMGTFRTTIEVAAGAELTNRRRLADVLIDTGSEYNWIPERVLAELGVTPVRIDRFETADGRIVDRPVGLAVIFAGNRSAATMVIFASPGEMTLLAAHGLDGPNLPIPLAPP